MDCGYFFGDGGRLVHIPPKYTAQRREIIEEAHRQGKQIQAKAVRGGNGKWNDVRSPLWMWERFDYRIKEVA